MNNQNKMVSFRKSTQKLVKRHKVTNCRVSPPAKRSVSRRFSYSRSSLLMPAALLLQPPCTRLLCHSWQPRQPFVRLRKSRPPLGPADGPVVRERGVRGGGYQ